MWALAWAACTPETDFAALVPAISVAPPSVDFGDVAVSETATAAVFVSNVGRAPLHVELAALAPFSVGPIDASIDPGDTVEVPVRYTPPTYLVNTAFLSLSSDDPERPTVEVALVGRGVARPAPDIAVAPTSLDFGAVAPGDSALRWLTIRNEGSAPLQIDGVEHRGSGDFDVLTAVTGQSIAAGGELPVVIDFSPVHDQGDSAFLTVTSDDPDEPRVEIALLGNGGSDGTYPVARVGCPSTVDPPEDVGVTDDGSDDPSGHLPLSFAWTLRERPSGSLAAIADASRPSTGFFADLGGRYVAELVVTNSLGVRSAPARCEIEAIPEDELHVELLWDTPHADLDLHLRLDEADLFERPGDCAWCNRSPAWGASLDLDDRSGYGPENINVPRPDPGGYDIAVHVFDDDGDGDVTATVRTWAYGALVDQRARVLTRNQVWTVGRANWPEGTLGLIDTVDVAAARECW